MNADAAFVTGKTHRVCQDYARADTKNGKYVVVSDGCSSAPDTDFGARLLVKSVENAILDPSSVDPLKELAYNVPPILPPFNSLANARAAAKVLQLSEYALDATVLLLNYRETSDGDKPPSLSIQATAYGDGVIAARRRENGVVEAHRVSYASGYPQYISYLLDARRQAKLAEVTKGNQARIDAWFVQKDGSHTESDWYASDELRQLWFFPLDQYDIVAAFSDGVESFTDASATAVPWQTIVADMMDFGPARKGEFVQRQMNWMVKELAKRKWSHHDDFTMGAINVEVSAA